MPLSRQGIQVASLFFVQEILGGVYKASWKNILKQQKRKFLVKIHS